MTMLAACLRCRHIPLSQLLPSQSHRHQLVIIVTLGQLVIGAITKSKYLTCLYHRHLNGPLLSLKQPYMYTSPVFVSAAEWQSPAEI
ncbi:hypothetical protein E2C01_069207 [Portunus trituberculatus]|uniref:Uncharacterized protein n=1 Tax=Portunus trituberculatus TaxID=210409 RepID=A0A5B7HTY5_PORTR|nr:hypothetical protein [Portunus trituberculatus]